MQLLINHNYTRIMLYCYNSMLIQAKNTLGINEVVLMFVLVFGALYSLGVISGINGQGHTTGRLSLMDTDMRCHPLRIRACMQLHMDLTPMYGTHQQQVS